MAPQPGVTDSDLKLRQILALMAPGTQLRDGLERILRGNTGGLLVLGHDKVVEQIATGGFDLDVPFTATGLRELAKMDGAIILDGEVSRISKAAVQLVPDPRIPTDETGTRHRTADRVARQTGLPVVSVSKSMRIIALYLEGRRYVLEDSAAILSRSNQALATLERYRQRLDEVTGTLSALEIEDLVTVRDVAAVVQRMEMVRRIASEIEGYVIELGTDGRLIALQLEELVSGVDAERVLIVRDYIPPATPRKQRTVDGVLADLQSLSQEDLLDTSAISKVMGLGGSADAAENSVSPKGYRLLARVPRLPDVVVERLVEHFNGLPRLLPATIDDLLAVEGVGEQRARSVREGLSRLAETSILERFV